MLLLPKNDLRVRHKGVVCEKVTSGTRRRGGSRDESVLLMDLLFPHETEGQTERLKTVTTRQMLTDVLKELEFNVCGPAVYNEEAPSDEQEDRSAGTQEEEGSAS